MERISLTQLTHLPVRSYRKHPEVENSNLSISCYHKSAHSGDRLNTFNVDEIAEILKNKCIEFNEMWNIDNESKISPITFDGEGKLYFATNEGGVYAVDEKTGQQKWKCATTTTFYQKPSVAPDGSVYVGSAADWDKSLYAIDREGKIKWNFNPSFMGRIVLQGLLP